MTAGRYRAQLHSRVSLLLAQECVSVVRHALRFDIKYTLRIESRFVRGCRQTPTAQSTGVGGLASYYVGIHMVSPTSGVTIVAREGKLKETAAAPAPMEDGLPRLYWWKKGKIGWPNRPIYPYWRGHHPFNIVQDNEKILEFSANPLRRKNRGKKT
uniref:Uncharacterized protein n=1 Tax=Rhodosorus marinus TaxID=101924 RepID=A0A7S3A5S8_9RHOD